MIVVTTPTGNVGRHVVRHLLDAGRALRLIVRDPARLPPDVRERVEVVEGSHGDAAVVDRAFQGADAVFWLCPPVRTATPDAQTVEFTRPAADAIRHHGVPRIVAVTTLGRGTAWQDRGGMATASIRMVDLLHGTGAAGRGLALPGFMDNALYQVATIRDGVMSSTLSPDIKQPHTATRDTGAAAARLLADASWEGQQDVPVLGPEQLSYADLADIVSDVVGWSVRYRQVPFEDWAEQLRERGQDPVFVQAYIDMLRAKDEGMDNAAPRASAIIGPTSFRQWVEEELKPVMAG